MFRSMLIAVWLALAIGQASAADGAFPDRPIRLVVAAPAGSTPDVGARAVAQAMSQILSQPVVVDNKPGANGVIAVQEVLKNAEDGYTLLGASGSTMAINPHIYAQQSSGMLKDLVAVGKIYSTDFYLIVQAHSGIDSMQTLVKRAKEKPGALVAANAGPGSASQLAVEVLKQQAGIDLYQVPFNGSPAAALGVASGNADLLIESLAVTEPFVSSGRVRRIAMTGQRRSSTHPELPTIAEAGVSGMEVSSWAGIFGRTKMPPERVAKLNAALNQALARPEVQTLLRTAGLTPSGGSNSDFQREWQAQSARWAEVVARTPGLKTH